MFVAFDVLFRRKLQELATSAIRQNIDGTVREHADVADALVHVCEQRFLMDDLVVLAQLEPENRLAGQAADEDARFPLWKQIAAIKREARWRDDRIPVITRLLQPFLLDDALADLCARVVDAMHDHGPPVVLALLNQIELVSAARTMFGFP